MTEILQYFPGAHASIFLEIKDANGQRVNDGYDGYTVPVVTRIILPSLTLAAGYPQPMTQLDVGLYIFTFILPTGAVAVGSYLVDVAYMSPINIGFVNTRTYQVIVSAAFGNYGVTTF